VLVSTIYRCSMMMMMMMMMMYFSINNNNKEQQTTTTTTTIISKCSVTNVCRNVANEEIDKKHDSIFRHPCSVYLVNCSNPVTSEQPFSGLVAFERSLQLRKLGLCCQKWHPTTSQQLDVNTSCALLKLAPNREDAFAL